MLHPSSDDLDDYVLGRLSGPALLETEQHLRICAECQWELSLIRDLIKALRTTPEGAVALRFCHHTADGLIISEVTRVNRRKWIARHSGPQLNGGVTTSTLSEAKAYLVESFAQMFPEHECTANCDTAVLAPRREQNRRGNLISMDARRLHH